MHFRTIFLSDIHLGSLDCQADRLLDFLRAHSCDELYLVGDIIDFWVLRKKTRWPDTHTEVLSAILAMAEAGIKVTYIPGNHDALVRRVYGSAISGIEVRQEAIHRTLQGRRFLVLHGDVFDELVLTNTWQHRLGGELYDFLMALSRRVNLVRRMLGLAHWSLANWLKYKFEKARSFIDSYEYAASKEAATRFLDGVVCGHIHHPVSKDVDGIRYLNCGDWVEHTTAIVETSTGAMALLDFSQAYQCQAVSGENPTAAQSPRNLDQAA